jgi:hypothetical protein
LEQVGVDAGRAAELCSMLRDKFNIDIAKEDVPKMTIAQ